MNKFLSPAISIILFATFATSSSAIAGKPSKIVAEEAYLEGPIVNPNSVLGLSNEASANNGILYYGEDAGFVQHNILLSNNQRSYVTVICVQGGNVVYQASQWGAGILAYTMEDLAGQGLEWYEGSGEANCTATLIVNEQKGKRTTITEVDQIAFDVM